jgi:uncharacterized protein YcbK (DUF882 family)
MGNSCHAWKAEENIVGDLGKYFNKDEFTCKCGCGKIDMDEDFISKLDLSREISKTSYVINSGYRCKDHNADVGGKPDSAHLKGVAADIKTDGSRKRFLVLKGLIDAGFNRIGIDLNKGFIHVDMDSTKDKDVAWGY